MSIFVMGLILLSVTISAAAQIVLKHGMSMPTVQLAGSHGFGAQLIAAMTNGHVLLGFLLYGAGAVLWLGVLARVDVGQAYPFVGLGFILTMIFGVLILGETINLSRALGTLLVMLGVILVARG